MAGAPVRGVLPERPVTDVQAEWHGTRALALRYRDVAGPVDREPSRVGAHDVGARAAVLGDTGKSRNLVCASFDWETSDVPALAFILTRVCPLLRGVSSTTRKGR
jgi:hypothetical protein